MQQAVPDLRLPVYNAPVNDHSKSQYDDQRADQKRDDRLCEDLIKSLLLFSCIIILILAKSKKTKERGAGFKKILPKKQ